MEAAGIASRSDGTSGAPRPGAAWTRPSISSGTERVVKIVLLDEAQRRFEAEDEWWREHRDAKELFVGEFARTLDQLSSTPSAGKRYRLTRGKLIQRVLMKKTRCHVYDLHDRERDLIEIHSIWVRVENEARVCSTTRMDDVTCARNPPWPARQVSFGYRVSTWGLCACASGSSACRPDFEPGQR